MSRMITAIMVGICFTSFSQNSIACNTPGEIINDTQSEFIATKFPSWDQVSETHKKILGSFFSGADLRSAYDQWIEAKNEQAASFFGIMRALSLIQVNIKGSEYIYAVDMVTGLIKAKGDRIIVQMNPVYFAAWQSIGGGYKVGKESGKVKFHDGGSMGGSLHCGYNVQGYTDRGKEPSVQWNYNYKTATADIDLDGHKPTWGGIFPNPKHLTYRNSDVRFWFDKFTSKYGDPGFKVVKREKK